MQPSVAIIWLCYNNLRHLPEVVASWAAQTYPRESTVIIAIPAGSPDGIEDVLRSDVLPRAGKDLPEVVILDVPNVGFSANNNPGIRYALERGADYVYLQNGDLKLDADAIAEAVRLAEARPDAGSVQSFVTYWGGYQQVNVTGGMVHAAGYGFARDNGKHVGEVMRPNADEIAYASGAAVLYRSDALRKVGLLEEGFQMYHEDLELGLRLRIAGYRNLLATASVAHHDYTFGRNMKMFAWIELYRMVVLLAYLRIPTLVLLAPLLLAIEVGTWPMAYMGGWLKAKLWATRQWFSPTTWRLVFRMRARVGALRTISDRELIRLWTGKIEAQEKANVIVDRIANPVVDALWRAIRCIIVW